MIPPQAWGSREQEKLNRQQAVRLSSAGRSNRAKKHPLSPDPKLEEMIHVPAEAAKNTKNAMGLEKLTFE